MAGTQHSGTGCELVVCHTHTCLFSRLKLPYFISSSCLLYNFLNNNKNLEEIYFFPGTGIFTSAALWLGCLNNFPVAKPDAQFSLQHTQVYIKGDSIHMWGQSLESQSPANDHEFSQTSRQAQPVRKAMRRSYTSASRGCGALMWSCEGAVVLNKQAPCLIIRSAQHPWEARAEGTRQKPLSPSQSDEKKTLGSVSTCQGERWKCVLDFPPSLSSLVSFGSELKDWGCVCS